MLLAKSCQQKFNINNGTIKLGTLYEYRSIENEELLDANEGMLTFRLLFDGVVEVPIQWFVTIGGGTIGLGDYRPTIFPGRHSAHIEKVNIERRTETTVVLRDSSAVYSRESLNSFIFCMSRVRKTGDCKGIFSGCDDYWYLRESQAQEFGVKLGGLLLQHIYSEHALGRFVLSENTDLEALEIRLEHRKVEYVAREVHLYDGSPLPLNEFMLKMANMAFTKPDSYRAELEYRFNFIAVCNGHIVEPLVKSVFLDSTPLLDLVFSL
ncbi:hypothetical protein [Pseudomonas sp. NFX98]|uniref:hypothetical protein n=1 Tax=Pseudomonas sp. NFX98 TaxID=3399122 RepID=UPI0039FCD359